MLPRAIPDHNVPAFQCKSGTQNIRTNESDSALTLKRTRGQVLRINRGSKSARWYRLLCMVITFVTNAPSAFGEQFDQYLILKLRFVHPRAGVGQRLFCNRFLGSILVFRLYALNVRNLSINLTATVHRTGERVYDVINMDYLHTWCSHEMQFYTFLSQELHK